jgi:hypothetical protein
MIPDLHGFRIGGDAWEAVRRLHADLSTRPGWEYPWEGLEADLKRAGRPLLLVGYGSLMNEASAAQTISPAVPARAVVAFGARRVFNYAMPEDVLARRSWPADPVARAALNAYRSPNPEDAINGACLEVPPAGVPALCARERGYDLQPVACLWWDEPAGRPFPAYILSAPDHPRRGPRWSDDQICPQPQYYDLCRRGAAAFSQAFLEFYLDTTFLADRRTTARTWERSRGTAT